MENAEGDGFLLFDRRVLNTVGLELSSELHVQSDVGLGVEGIFWLFRVRTI